MQVYIKGYIKLILFLGCFRKGNPFTLFTLISKTFKIYSKQQLKLIKPIMKIGLIALLLVLQARSCFIVHFVYYAGLPMYYFDRFVDFPHPYILHYNEPINWINGFKVNRTMSYVEQADVKRMEVLYNYGGVYLDSDMLVDVQCLKKHVCTKKEDRLYLMDWVYKDFEKWLKAVPIAFLYAPKPKLPVFEQILTNYNQSIDLSVNFSGPYYIQRFKDQLRFMQVQPKCQLHIGTQSFSANNVEFSWIMIAMKGWLRKRKIKIKRNQSQNKFNFLPNYGNLIV